MSKYREYAAMPFIYAAFLLLRFAAVVAGKSARGKVGISYDDNHKDKP